MEDPKPSVFRFGEFEASARDMRLTRNGQYLAIEPKAFRVLVFLLRNPDRLVTKEELLSSVWSDTAVTENSLTRAVALLRKTLDDDTREPRFIATIPTAGYRFIGHVETILPDTAVPAPAPLVPVPASRGLTGRKTLRISLAAGAVIAFAILVWYLLRPLPPLQITGYTQITHDGRDKIPAGTDGSRIYFTQMSPRSINQVGVNGGETAPVPLAVPGNKFALVDVSQDGSSGLVASYDANPWSLWAVPILGGSARRVGEGEDGAFSPDGEFVIYSTTAGDIMVARRDGTEPRKLANPGPGAHSFRWSPDRRVIRFYKDDGLWQMAPDGSGLHRLMPDWRERGIQCCGRWTPDGHFYLFLLFNTSSPGSQIWALDERRGLVRRPHSQPVRLTTGPLLWRSAIPSADGRKIFAAGLTLRGELSRIDPKTGGLQPFLGGISAEFLSFSPDGKSIAYVTFPEGSLWIANRDGSNRLQVSEPPERVGYPRWSPDSKRIVFLAANTEGHFSNYIVSVDGGKPRRLLPEDGTDQHDPNWSPDGTKILFGWGTRETKDGGNLRILDLASRQVLTVPGSNGRWSPRWSPDGRYIAALDRTSQTVLHVFDLKEQRWSTLQLNADALYPAFSSDGQFVYFVRLGSVQNVSRVRITGGNVEQVADLKDWHLTGQFLVSMTLDPTDAPLVLRDVGSNDIYALTLERK